LKRERSFLGIALDVERKTIFFVGKKKRRAFLRTAQIHGEGDETTKVACLIMVHFPSGGKKKKGQEITEAVKGECAGVGQMKE